MRIPALLFMFQRVVWSVAFFGDIGIQNLLVGHATLLHLEDFSAVRFADGAPAGHLAGHVLVAAATALQFACDAKHRLRFQIRAILGDAGYGHHEHQEYGAQDAWLAETFQN